MTVTAYVLIQTEVGRAEKVATAARAIDGVVNADNVAGPYDVIVKAESSSLDELGQLVPAPRCRQAGSVDVVVDVEVRVVDQDRTAEPQRHVQQATPEGWDLVQP